MPRCPRCQAEVSATARFCPRDGTDLGAPVAALPSLTCPQCARTYSAGRFCVDDGSTLVPAEPDTGPRQ